MKCYRAIAGKYTYTSGFYDCLHWAQSQLKQHKLIKIEKQFAGEKNAQVVAEVSCEGVRLIRHGSIRRVSRVET